MCYTQQIKLECVTKVIQCNNIHAYRTGGVFVSHCCHIIKCAVSVISVKEISKYLIVC